MSGRAWNSGSASRTHYVDIQTQPGFQNSGPGIGRGYAREDAAKKRIEREYPDIVWEEKQMPEGWTVHGIRRVHGLYARRVVVVLTIYPWDYWRELVGLEVAP